MYVLLTVESGMYHPFLSLVLIYTVGSRERVSLATIMNNGSSLNFYNPYNRDNIFQGSVIAFVSVLLGVLKYLVSKSHVSYPHV